MLAYIIVSISVLTPIGLIILLRFIFRFKFNRAKRRKRNPREGLSLISQYRYNRKSNTWEKYKNDDNVTLNIGPFRCITFNTLFDLYVSRHSQERYEYQMNRLLPVQNADVIVLNEVTPHYLSQLLAQEWVREHYFVSRFSEKKGYKRKTDFKHFFSVIMSKKPFHSLYHYWFDTSIKTKRCAIVALFKCSDHSFLSVCGVHLVAREKRHHDRAKQIKELLALLRKPDYLLHDVEQVSSYSSLLMGDMNVHLQSEEKYFTTQKDVRVRDLWSELRPREGGYTLDSLRNLMVNNGRNPNGSRLRLDRMLLIEPCNQFKHMVRCNNINLFADEPIDKNRKIFPSDHFGLLAEVELLG